MKKVVRLIMVVMMTPIDWILWNTVFIRIYGYMSIDQAWKECTQRSKDLLP